MRHSTLALLALLSSASAFAPAKISTTHRSQSSLHAVQNDNNNNNQFGNQIEDAKNAFLGTVTAATLFMGTLAPLPGDAANAAAAAPPAAPATATKTTAAAKKAEPVAAPVPLAAEKAAVASAKAAFTATQKVS